VAAAPEVDERWAEAWYGWLGAAFLGAYLDRVGSWEALPGDRDDLGTLLDLFVLDRALGELGDELEARPESAGIPIRGALAILGPR
jgi:maltose alpha-D-glucosyltransferase/alpha-amylase